MPAAVEAEVVPLEDLVEGWLRAGDITPAQAARLSGPRSVLLGGGDGVPGPSSSMSVAEPLAYLGGAVAASGAVLVVSHYWEGLETLARLGLLLAATAALFVAGLAVPARLGAPGRRLRGVLWLASTATAAGAAVVVIAWFDVDPATARVGAAALSTGYAAVLWVAHRYGAQQIALMAAVAAVAALAVDRWDLPGQSGHALALVGVVWVLLGLAGVFRPPRVPRVLGAGTVVLGAMTTAHTNAGMVLTLVAAVAVLAAGAVLRDLLLLALGVVAVLVNVPAAMSRWFPDSVAASAGLMLGGAATVAVAVWVARRSPAPPRGRSAP